MHSDKQAVASMRCPVCFTREVDVLLLHDGQNYYCVKCSFSGDADAVRDEYTHIRQKFRNRERRITSAEIDSL